MTTHLAGDTHHVSCIGYDQAIEAKLFPEQALQKFGSHGCGHDLLVLDSGAQSAGIGRLLNVTDHYRRDTGIDHSLVNLTEGSIPFFAAQVIDRGNQVLVTLVTAVAGEMLHTTGNTGFMGTLHVGKTHFQNLVRIIAKSTGGDDAISPVQVDIHDGSKGPVAANGGSFFAAEVTHCIGTLRIIRCTAGNTLAQLGAAGHGTITACFHIGCDQGRDLTGALDSSILLVELVRACVVIAVTAQLISGLLGFYLFGRVVPEHIHEYLVQLFLLGHGCKGAFHPFKIILGQIKRFLCVIHSIISLCLFGRVVPIRQWHPRERPDGGRNSGSVTGPGIVR